jgi:hypothetical protein
MKITLSAILLMSSMTSAIAQQRDECPRPGLIQSKEVDMSGAEESNSHQRIGSANIEDSFSVNGSIRTRIFRNYVDRVCVEKPYVETREVCEPVSVDVALGRGNATLKGIYNLAVSLTDRARNFASNIKYSDYKNSTERLAEAMSVVRALSNAATMRGLPKSMDDLGIVLNEAMKRGEISYALMEEITVTNRGYNENALGFRPLPGVKVNQGTGNGRLNAIFDFSQTPQTRATRLQQIIVGVPSRAALALSNSFISYASMNGIPNSWDGVVLMMRNAVAQNVITEGDLQMMTVQYEDVNRSNLGYEVSAEICRMAQINRSYNVVEVRNRQEVARTVTMPYEINIQSAPLLAGERESLVLTSNGLRNLDLRLSSSFNRYQVKGIEQGGVMKFTVVGTRLAVTPPNTLKVKFDKRGDVLNIRVANTGFNSKIGGKVMIKVRYIDGGFFKDKTLGEESYELDGSKELVETAKFRHKDVDFVKVSMQIIGSPYYSQEASDEVKAKD